MAQPYSNDFRQKVIEAIELDGLKQSEAAQPLSQLQKQILALMKLPESLYQLHLKSRKT